MVNPEYSAAPGHPTLSLGSPTDLIAVVPYLLPGPPDHSMALLGLSGAARRVRFAVRHPLDGGPAPGTAPPADVAAGFARTLREHGCDRALAVGYGPPGAVTPLVDALVAGLSKAPVELCEALRVENGRYWSYLCPYPSCCPADGVVFDTASSLIPATAVAAGLVPRGSHARATQVRLDPVTGALRERMAGATHRAEARCARMWGGPRAEDGSGFGPELRAEGVRLVRQVVAALPASGPPEDPDLLAWLGVVLVATRVRDEAWAHISAEHAEAHIALWSHVLRRVRPAYAAAPAALLAFAAWQQGDTALAAAAALRAERAHRGYSMAALIRRALHLGVRPDTWRHFSPEWLEEISPVRGPGGRAGPEATSGAPPPTA
ncbi:uncharacterized protein DUF4192 [Murinocardiopsis flavida]|uniref:Uncharacterized protein DUF4192 n=1 Tax=Murinocardiopsis flavida TaxID=645275 RepID=A0A2P8DUF2_9ACTN|nr:DUF4192 domain-containing protein [Murinocardiopsis flavida]PSL00832.1 uncharacterized protein DUF4192 [Murinocardiopsis flavida]